MRVFPWPQSVKIAGGKTVIIENRNDDRKNLRLYQQAQENVIRVWARQYSGGNRLDSRCCQEIGAGWKRLWGHEEAGCHFE